MNYAWLSGLKNFCTFRPGFKSVPIPEELGEVVSMISHNDDIFIACSGGVCRLERNDKDELIFVPIKFESTDSGKDGQDV